MRSLLEELEDVFKPPSRNELDRRKTEYLEKERAVLARLGFSSKDALEKAFQQTAVRLIIRFLDTQSVESVLRELVKDTAKTVPAVRVDPNDENFLEETISDYMFDVYEHVLDYVE